MTDTCTQCGQIIHQPEQWHSVVERIRAMVIEFEADNGFERLSLLGHRAQKHLAQTRQYLYAVAYYKFHASYAEVGEAFDFRDHTTIIHGVRAHMARMAHVAGVDNKEPT